jgi:hypothetical protein
MTRQEGRCKKTSSFSSPSGNSVFSSLLYFRFSFRHWHPLPSLLLSTAVDKDGQVITLPQVLRQILDTQWQEHLVQDPDCPFVFPGRESALKTYAAHENGLAMRPG